MDNNMMVEFDPKAEAAVTMIDQRDAKIARLAEAWEQALAELFDVRAAA